MEGTAPAPSAPATPSGGGSPAPAPKGAPAPASNPSTHVSTGRSPRLPPLQGAPKGAGAPAAEIVDDAPPPARPERRTVVDPKAKPKREPIIYKHVGEDGSEMEIDIADFLATYKRKSKIDGEELEVGVDDAFRSYERVRASMKRFDEANKIKTVAEQRVKAAENMQKRLEGVISDPVKAFDLLERVLGPNMLYRAMAERISARAKYENLSPEQRAQVDAQRAAEQRTRQGETALQQRERKIQEREAAIARKEAAETQARVRGELTKELADAGLPATKLTISIIAGIRGEAARSGVKLEPDEVISQVREELSKLMGDLGKDPEALREVVGDDGANALRQAEVDRLNRQPGRLPPGATSPGTSVRGGPPAPPRAQRTEAPATLDAFRQNLRNRNRSAAR